MKLTQAQLEKAKERRQKLCAIARSISKMSPEERARMVRDWPTTIEGHKLSLHNACMIAFQGGGVSVVGGFRQWKKAGRSVKKGEHGFGIWVPLGLPKQKNEASDAETFSAENPVGFTVATVFDISQTESREAVAA